MISARHLNFVLFYETNNMCQIMITIGRALGMWVGQVDQHSAELQFENLLYYKCFFNYRLARESTWKEKMPPKKKNRGFSRPITVGEDIRIAVNLKLRAFRETEEEKGA